MLVLKESILDSSAYLIVLGDIHLGDKLFTKRSEEKLRGYIDWVKKTPGARVFLNGDIFNCATKTSKTSPFEINESGDDEVDKAVEIFAPIADKIIGATDGNHERRLIEFANFSPINTLCQRLSTKERRVKYCGSSCLLFIKVGQSKFKSGDKRSAQTYSGYIHHTTGGGKTIGSKMNRVDELRKIMAGCDFYCGSHNHMEGVAKVKIFLPNPNNCTMTEVRQQIIDCGGFLDYGGYVEDMALSPVDLGAPRIRFDSIKKDIHVSL